MAERVLEGGEVLKKYLEQISVKMSGTLKAGFLSGATYPDGTLVAAVAFWNEFGHKGRFPAPPRPFFRSMVSAESPTWGPKLAKLAVAMNYDGEKILGMLGEDIAGALRQSITELMTPELSPTTLMLREIYGNSHTEIRARDVLAAQELVAEGHTGASGTQAKPLVWTGHMLNSVDYEVGE